MQPALIGPGLCGGLALLCLLGVHSLSGGLWGAGGLGTKYRFGRTAEAVTAAAASGCIHSGAPGVLASRHVASIDVAVALCLLALISRCVGNDSRQVGGPKYRGVLLAFAVEHLVPIQIVALAPTVGQLRLLTHLCERSTTWLVQCLRQKPMSHSRSVWGAQHASDRRAQEYPNGGRGVLLGQLAAMGTV